ncbi:MAG: exo-alpha-sialidase, partial [Proteobacteria bacterium]|nr:exo-alpha-sialidase [Pseudomonadota bacterium]
ELTHDPIAQDVHCLVQCPKAPDRFWVQHHNGIFVSSDEAKTFAEIKGVEPSVFGFPVAVHPTEPDTAWFVPEIKDEKRIPVGGRLCLTRTRDGGKTFETLSKGLPQDHAYDVVYRHALALDDEGKRLAFGSTTGGLWVSEDQGDSWQMVSHTLPPVYAVRFG